jgi:hypothetical protein
LFTTRATLCAIGIKLRELKIFETIGDHVRVPQKNVRHTPLEKLTDAFIALLAGASGLCEINTRVRADRALQKAFGRASCAEQSTVQETLSACTRENVRQMRDALNAILKKCGRTYSHPYEKKLQLLDADMSGLPSGPKAELAARGYFPKRYECHGRQLARVTSALYHEVVTDVVCPGNVQLRETLCPLVELTEEARELNAENRRRTVWRVDAGVGSLRRVNWLLGRGYQIHLKDCSSKRAEAFAQKVREWHRDPDNPEREFGWATGEKLDNLRNVRRLILRAPHKKGGVYYAARLSTLTARQVFDLLEMPAHGLSDPGAVLHAYVKLYDGRGGAVEIEFKQDKQGFGLTKRNKKSYFAQQIVQMLGTLAHNVLRWAIAWLSKSAPKLNRYGSMRIVRDVFAAAGRIEINAGETIQRIVINRAVPLARALVKSLRLLLKPFKIKVILGET